MNTDVSADVKAAARTGTRTGVAGGLVVDWTRCDGHGLCKALLPRSVRLDDWGYPIIDVNMMGRETETDRARAVAVCPALALRRSG